MSLQARAHERAVRDRSRTTTWTVLCVIGAGLSFVYSMLTGAVALDVCREGCELPVNLAVMGVAWGGIVVAAIVGGTGVKRARARQQPTAPWVQLALLIIVASGVAGVVVTNTVAGLM